MYVGSYAICVLNWNWWLTQDHFLIKHWSQRTHRCSARVVGLESIHWGLVSRYSTVRSGTLTWREWGLWFSSLKHSEAYISPRTDSFHKSHNTSGKYPTMLLQNGALWEMGLAQSGVCPTGLLNYHGFKWGGMRSWIRSIICTNTNLLWIM